MVAATRIEPAVTGRTLTLWRQVTLFLKRWFQNSRKKKLCVCLARWIVRRKIACWVSYCRKYCHFCYLLLKNVRFVGPCNSIVNWMTSLFRFALSAAWCITCRNTCRQQMKCRDWCAHICWHNFYVAGLWLGQTSLFVCCGLQKNVWM